MIRKLTEKDKQQVLDFCYLRERENLFVIGSFKNYKDTFKANNFYGYFKGDEMAGLGVFFKRFGNFVINAQDKKVLEGLVDFGMKDGLKIEAVAAFKKYAEATVKRLKQKHDIHPQKKTDETVFILEKKDFTDFSDGSELQGTDKDVDDLVRFNRGIGFEAEAPRITEKDRKKVFADQNFYIMEKGKIISKANIHGTSKQYFQIGGVGTLEEYRSKGLAKRVVSSLCKYYFGEGLKTALLFSANDNGPAHKVYKALGFKPVDKFIIAYYE